MKVWKWLNALAFILTLTLNALANLLPIGGNTTGEVSARYPTLFTPTPAAFAVWGVIYLLMAYFVVRQWGASGKTETGEKLRRAVGVWFFLGCLFNSAWILCWHLDKIGLSTVCIAGLLLTLAVTEERLRTRKNVLPDLSLIYAGFDLYFGWIIAATIANVAVWLKKTGWDGFGKTEVFWTVVMLAAGTLIGTAATLVGSRRYTGLAVAWAFGGILFRHVSAKGYALAYPAVVAAAGCGTLVLLAVSLFFVRRPSSGSKARYRR